MDEAGSTGPPADTAGRTPDTVGDRRPGGLLSEEERCRILAQLPVPVAYFGRDQFLSMANGAAAESVGRTEAALLGLRPGEVEPGLFLEGGKGSPAPSPAC